MAKHSTPKISESRVFNWRHFDPAQLPNGRESALATELVTYRDHLDEILAHEKSGGLFVAIKGTEILGYYPSRRSAVNAAVARFGSAPVLIKRIMEVEPAQSFGAGDI